MALESLREQIKDKWTELSAQIQETSTFNTLREKFESQSIGRQRGIIASAGVIVVLTLLSFPWGYYSASNEHLHIFEENRTLIRGLLRASRTSSEAPPLPPPKSFDDLRSQVERALRDARLVPEQIGEIRESPESPAKNLAPAVVQQTSLVVQIKKINVNQIVQLGAALQNLGAGTKMIGLNVVQTTGQTYYYDMIATLVHFGLPSLGGESGSDKAFGTGSKKLQPQRPANEDEEVAE